MIARPSAARPRILHVVDNLGAGGLQKNLLTLIEQTSERFSHSICCVRNRGGLVERFEAASAAVVDLDKAFGTDWSIPWRIAQHCRRIRPDIVHTRNWGAIDGVVGARMARVPVVIHSEHGWDTTNAPARRRWVLWALSTGIDAVVAVSDHLRRWLSEDVGIAPGKLRLVRNGVDTNRFRPREDRDRLRRERGYQREDRVVAAVGRLDPVKNYPVLVAAFEEVARLDAQARLLVVGTGPQRDSIEREIERRHLGSIVRFAGYCDDVEDWLAMADVFVHPSLSEGMTNAALEAMASGLPIVATRVGGLQEMVVDGVTGRLVSGGDVAALAAAMTSYCADAVARGKHGNAGRARVLAEFTLQAMISGYVTLYEGMLARRGMLPVGDTAPHRS